ncbi:hypothetical protein Pyn_10969 [Prunus yedoensis var. nudiflora]|uniref:Uncharacterized protein n=1 Tax=Prunus yedoensis var. nudiflora TaxID=2094558 RepID=A0A314V2C8_PRUYE|nr:hypothetical protein Pyn_10969 [Prunus yedoensis var. nudiflora]
MFCLLFNVVCVYCWQLKWINEDFLSYSLEFNFMQTLLLDFLVSPTWADHVQIHILTIGSGWKLESCSWDLIFVKFSMVRVLDLSGPRVDTDCKVDIDVAYA